MKNLLTLLLFFFTTHLLAQQVTYSFNKQKILLGEALQMKMQTFVRSGEMPASFAYDTLPHFEVLDRSKIDTVLSGNLLQLTQVLTITSWDSGRWALPAVIINNVPSRPVNIEVTYTPNWDPKQPYHDIKGIIPVKHPGKDSWWWYIIGVAVLLALFLLFFPASKKENTAEKLDSNAYKKAMQQLDKLQKEHPASAGVKSYYTELITIFRTYLKNGKGIQSFSRTTDDLGLQLQTAKMPADEYNGLLQNLRLSDLVKFAQYVPDDETTLGAYNSIKQSITTIEQGYAV